MRLAHVEIAIAEIERPIRRDGVGDAGADLPGEIRVGIRIQRRPERAETDARAIEVIARKADAAADIGRESGIGSDVVIAVDQADQRVEIGARGARESAAEIAVWPKP
ncbi:MAG: hypothetical protein WDO24_29730 [Pseudomonadota bacterium]